MAKLAELGVTVERKFLADEDVTEIAFTLPKPTSAQATFRSESFGERLLKVFKKELQTGDGIFDEAVLIKTDTEEVTSELLKSVELRAVIERVVTSGGAVELDGAFVKLEMPGRNDIEESLLVHLVQALS